MRNIKLLGLIFFMMFCIALAPTPAHSITIMKNVGHGDCYVVISDGRIVIIDLGPTSSADGLISLLKSGYSHFDRIVITHVHSDHIGGLITAQQYAKQKGSALSTDMLVSNHGEHDVDVVIRESKLKPLLASLRTRPIVGIEDQAPAKLALADDNIAIEGFKLNESMPSGNENISGLVLKVTEIRNGKRRATLFLGDIEKSEQSKLFSHSNVEEIFRDVKAITLPHHGRPATLYWRFFSKIKKFAGQNVVLLHSDRNPLDSRAAAKAAKMGLTVKSTAESAARDIFVNLFGSEKTYHLVETGPTNLATIVKSEKSMLI